MSYFKEKSILVSGATGFIGSAVRAELEQNGAFVRNITRIKRLENDIVWDPDEIRINPSDINGSDIIYHLAGENIANKRWTRCQKHYLLLNRSNGVRTLRKALQDCEHKPRLVVIASAVGFYGVQRGVCDEQSPLGHNFPAKICEHIESEAKRIAELGIHVQIVRFGVVLGPNGGALDKMLLPFKMGMGGRLGNGKQPFPWISLQDAVRSLLYLSVPEHFKPNTGSNHLCIANIVAPAKYNNADFTSILADTLNRPAFMHMPSPIAKLLFGEMGKDLLLTGSYVYPKHLTSLGFVFNHTLLEDALAYALA
jgi:uncharacterized protein (TIGR01777 family)